MRAEEERDWRWAVGYTGNADSRNWVRDWRRRTEVCVDLLAELEWELEQFGKVANVHVDA